MEAAGSAETSVPSTELQGVTSQKTGIFIVTAVGISDFEIFPRHGRKHTIRPSSVNYRANIWALREVGCTHVLASTACGSLQEEIKPGDLVLMQSFIDRCVQLNIKLQVTCVCLYERM